MREGGNVKELRERSSSYSDGKEIARKGGVFVV